MQIGNLLFSFMFTEGRLELDRRQVTGDDWKAQDQIGLLAR